jgi:hypothetical protein
MIAAAAASGRRLKVFANLVFYPPLVSARELLREGAIGRPLHFRMKVMMADRAQVWHVPDAASRWRHALATEGRGGPMVFDHGHHDGGSTMAPRFPQPGRRVAPASSCPRATSSTCSQQGKQKRH